MVWCVVCVRMIIDVNGDAVFHASWVEMRQSQNKTCYQQMRNDGKSNLELQIIINEKTRMWFKPLLLFLVPRLWLVSFDYDRTPVVLEIDDLCLCV